MVDAYTLTSERLDYQTNLAQGLDADQRAVSLAPDLGEAHASLAWGLWNVGEWVGSEREFDRAIELNPGYATAHHWYSVLLWTTGRASEGVIPAQRALELDPVSRIISSDLGRALWLAGRTEEAIEQYRETTELAPEWPIGWVDLAWALLESGEYEEGLEVRVNSARLIDADVQAARVAYEAVIRYRETGEPQTFADYDGSIETLLWLYIHSGQADRYFELFEQSLIRVGAYGYAAMNHVESNLGDLLGDDPRYQALLEEAGITW